MTRPKEHLLATVSEIALDEYRANAHRLQGVDAKDLELLQQIVLKAVKP